MNIQINCKDNVTEQDLRYIYYNLPDIIKEYEETKNNIFHKKIINGKPLWYKKIEGNFMISTNIEVTANERTLYFKIRR